MDTREESPGSRARWLGVLLIVLALGVVAFKAWRSHAGPPPAGAVASGIRTPSLFEAGSGVEEAEARASAVVVASRSSPERPLAEDEVQVCGLGRFKKDVPEETERMEAALKASDDGLGERVRRGLLASGDETERAVGLYAEAIRSAGKQTEQAPERETPEQFYQRFDSTALDRLVDAAVSTRSPQVYSLALHLCDMNQRSGKCRLLSNEQWARLDPGNAAPWLRVISAVGQRQDASTTINALHQIGRSTASETYGDRMLGVALKHIPGDAPTLSRFAVMVEYVGLSAAVLPQYAPIMKVCSVEAMRDTNRQQACSAAAETLVRSNNLIDVAVGTRLGEWAGWPTERVHALRDEREMAYEALANETDMVNGGMGCAAMERQLRHIGNWARHGEMNALREQIRHLPEGASSRARQRWQAAEARRDAEAAQRAASAAGTK